MSFLNKYPYTDFHELNLDWILDKLREMGIRMDEFEAVNTITFSGAWDITQQYQPWTVVENGNVGYISIQPVPVGIAITNTNYWRVIVDYTAEIAGIHSDINDLQTDVAAIQREIDPGKWLFMGDSYENYGHWYSQVCNILGLTNGTNAHYAGGSGHGFTAAMGKWVDDFTGFCTGRSDLSQFKNIVIVGGLNDSTASAMDNNASVLKAAIQTFVQTVEAQMPNALITVAYVGSALADSPDIQGRIAARRIYTTQVYRQEFTRYGHRYLRNCEYCMYRPQYFLSDGIHPTAAAAAEISNNVGAALINGSSCTVESDYRSTSDTAFSSGELHAYQGLSCTVTNDRSVMILRMIVCQQITTGFTIGTTAVDLGALPSICYIRNTNPQRVIAQVSNSGSASWMICSVYVQNGHLYIMSDTLTTGPVYKTLTVNVGDRFDLGTITFDENTMFTQ